jgi:hypothetical protein
VTIPAPASLLAAFRPSPPLARFASDAHPLIVIRAANEVGKTYQVTRKVALRAVNRPGSRHRIVGPSRSQVRESTGRYLWEFLQGYLDPRSRWNSGTGWNRNGVALLANGSEIQLSSYEDDPQVQEGRHDLDTIVLDEVPKRAHFEANVGRGKHQVILAFTVQSRSAPEWLRREIEGGEPSPLSGRTLHATGWVQYVVPFRRENVPWMDDLYFERQRARHLGKEAEGRRLNALWESMSDDRVLDGWSSQLRKSVPEIRKMLTGADGKITGVSAWYGIDYGNGRKQVQYLCLHQQGRYYIVHEYVGRPGATMSDNAQGIRDALRAWIHQSDEHGLRTLALPGNGIRGDINSSGPAGGGEPLNLMMERHLALLYGVSELPFRITAATKQHGYKEMREVAMNHAMLERRFFVADCCPVLIRACQEYEGGRLDPHKDPIDAVGYALEDLLMVHRSASPRQVRR